MSPDSAPDMGADMRPAMDEVPPPERLGAVHFLGIGGAGLSGFARLLLARRIEVSGSDAKDSPTLSALAELGATVWVGHPESEAAARLSGIDTVVVSTAVKDTNPELVEARRRGLRVLTRAAALRSLTSGYRVIAVSGAHGKTTTSAMLAVALRHCGADPSYAIGGVLADTGTNAHHGTGELFVIEADESDGSFLQYAPELAVVTNVDPDHLDRYGTEAAYHAAFDTFAETIRPGGTLVASLDDPGATRTLAHARAKGIRTRTFGTAPDADVRIDNIRLRPLGGCFDPVIGPSGAAQGDGTGDGAAAGRAGGTVGATVEVNVAGRHHLSNAAAAYAAAIELGFSPDVVAAGLSAFSGTGRRFEFKGEAAGVRVFDDYAHHPTELRTNLEAARAAAAGGRVVVCYRPLRYTRTQLCHVEFGKVLGLADEVVVTDPTGDDPIPGVTGALITDHVELPPERVHYEPSWPEVPARVAERLRPGDLLLTAGAPDVAGVGPAVLGLLT